MKKADRPPADLDGPAKRKWRELCDAVDPDDHELLANFCRQHSILLAIRAERARLIRAKTFATMIPGRDKALQLNPLLTAEARLTTSLNRQLRGLGLAPERQEQFRRSKAKGPETDRPPGATGPEPPWGWDLEMKLCGDDKDFLPGGKYGPPKNPTGAKSR